MKFPRRKREDSAAKLQMAPMVDIVFQLLIFFLVASEVRPTEAQFRANLPSWGHPPIPNRPEPVPKEIYRVYLKTTEDGRTVEVSINGDVLGRGRAGFKTLSERLCRLGNTENVILVIDGDPEVHTQFVTDALDCAADAQIRQVAFANGRM